MVEAVTAPASLEARFEMRQLLGQGGMGVVYLALDLRLQREVAVKLLANQSSELAALFETEARLLASLEHDHIVRVYDYGLADGIPYLVMELMRGRSLAARLSEGRPTPVESVRMTQDILKGVGEAHRRGIVHRDLKPGNIFLEENGRVKVADFGLAYRREPDDDGHEKGGRGATTGGTPGYMSPEQRRGQMPGTAGDIYSVGVLLHEMLTGVRLVQVVDRARLVSGEPLSVPPPSRVNPCAPETLDALVLRILDDDPAKRPDAATLIGLLEEWVEKAHRPSRRVARSELPAHPYKFLEHYGVGDRSIFFGREAEVGELRQLILNPTVRVIFLFGPCGIGKSSLLHAGLLANLDPHLHDPLVIVSGANPALRICEAVVARTRSVAASRSRLVDLDPKVLVTSPGALLDLLVWLHESTRKTQVFVLDQLEEVFTQNPRGSSVTASLFGLVQRLAEAQTVVVKLVLSFRTEFRGNFYPLEERLGKLQRSVAVREIGESALVEIIEGPSRMGMYGFRYQDGLAPYLALEILKSMRGAADTVLPVLQIVCRQLYDRMKAMATNVITKELYASSLGGVGEVLNRYVEERLQAPTYPHRGAIARQMLKALTIKEGGDRFARPRAEDELLDFPDREAARRTLQQLIEDHLIVRVDSGAEGQIRLASEVICRLVEGWALEENDVDRAAKVLARSFRQWSEGGQKSEDLLSGTALSLVTDRLPALGGLSVEEHGFIHASRKRQRWRWISAVALVAMVTILGCSILYTSTFKPGALSLHSEPPGAQVYLGHKLLGETPMVWEARPGVYGLTLKKSPYEPAVMDVKIPPGGLVEFSPVLRYPFGILAVGSEPSGTVCEVWREKGATKPIVTRKTPFTTELPAGTYSLTLIRSGYVPSNISRVILGANRELVHTVITLKKDTGWLDLTTWSQTAEVTIRREKDGNEAERKPVWVGSVPATGIIELPVGKYQAEALCSCYNHQIRSVEISRRSTSSVAFWLDHGQRIWTSELGEMAQTGPAIADLNGDGVFDVVVGANDQKVHALSGKDGTPLWEFPTGAEIVSSPTLTELDGDGVADVVIGSNDRKVYALSGKTGKKLWDCETGGSVSSSPAVADLDGDGIADAVVGSRDRRLWALSGKNGSTLWTYDAHSGIHSSPALADFNQDGIPDAVFGSLDGVVHAVSGKGGAVLWTYKTGGEVQSSPALGDVDGDLIPDVAIGSCDEKVYVLSGRNGKLLWRLVTDGPVFSSPTLADLDGDKVPDLVVGSADQRLFAVSGRTQKAIWVFKTNGAIHSSPSLADLNRDGVPDVVVRANNGRLYVVDGRTADRLFALKDDGIATQPAPVSLADFDGDSIPDLVRGSLTTRVLADTVASDRAIWVNRLGGVVLHAPALADLDGDGRFEIVAGTSKGTVHGLSGSSGQVLWTFTMHSPISGPPTLAWIDEDSLPDAVIGSRDGHVYALSGRTGHRIWENQTSGAILGEPVVAPLGIAGALTVTVGTQEGWIVAYALKTGTPTWSFKVDGPVYLAPRPCDLNGDGVQDIILISGRRRVEAFSGSTRRRLWSFTLSADTRAVPILADVDRDGTLDVIVADLDKRVQALSGKTGVALWTTTLKEQISSTPAVGDLDLDGVDDVVLSTHGKQVTALSGKTGATLWKVTLEKEVSEPVLVHTGEDPCPDVVVATRGENLHILSGRTGQSLFVKTPVSGSLPFTPILIDRDGLAPRRLITWREGRQGPPITEARKGPRRFAFLHGTSLAALVLADVAWPLMPATPPTPVSFTSGRSPTVTLPTPHRPVSPLPSLSPSPSPSSPPFPSISTSPSSSLPKPYPSASPRK